jgi:hypothetical protein
VVNFNTGGKGVGQKIRVRVTREHLLAGRRSSRFRCPIALAIGEMFPGVPVVVQLDVIRIGRVTYPTPRRAAQAMGYYDSSRSKADVKPIDFTLKGNGPDDVHLWQRGAPLRGGDIFAETITVACGRKLVQVKVGPFKAHGGMEPLYCEDCQKKQSGDSHLYTYQLRGTMTR